MPTNNCINAPMGSIAQYLMNDDTPYAMFNPLQCIRIADDFLAGASSKSYFGWANVVINSGSIFAAGGSSTNPGIYSINTQTNTAGGSTLHSGLGTVQLGGGRVITEFLVQVSALSDGTNTYIARIGLGNTTNAAHTNGCWFEYTHSVNAGKWTLNTADNSSVTTANSNNSVAASTWTRLTIDVNAAASSVAFYVNGTQCANSPITTNIPTAAGRTCGPNIQIVKSAGTSGRSMLIDYCSFYQKLTASR
jgi:hypothetical protein